MNLDIDNEKVKWLSALIYTKSNSVELYKYQISKLSAIAKNIYITYLRNELSEKSIDKMLEVFYKDNFDNRILIEEPFVNTKVLSEVEVYNANWKFLDGKLCELKKFLELVNKDNSLKPPAHLIEQFNTFTWKSSPESLNLLYNELVENKFIAKINFSLFQKGFSGKYVEKPFAIPWLILSRNKMTSKVSLIYLLNNLHPDFIEFPFSEGYNKLSKVFFDKNSQPFKDIKQSMSSYHTSDLKDKLIKSRIDNILQKLKTYQRSSKVR